LGRFVFADVAQTITTRDPSWLGRSDLAAISRGAHAQDAVELHDFPVIADDEYAGAYRALVDQHDHYRVRRIFLMSIPDCTLAGPQLVALRDESYIVETTRGAKSFRDRRVFSSDDDGYRVRPGASSVRFDEPVAVAGGAATSGYFHWMTEIVPRLQVLIEAGLDVLPILMRPAPHAFQRQSLEWLGVEPWFVEEGLVHVPRAVVPSFPIHPKRGGRYSPELIDRATDFRARSVPRRTDATPTRIYVSRGDAAKRKVANEAELETMLRAAGFECLTLSERALDEQIHLFTHAEVIVAQHGAGLTNIMFARPGTRVVELYPRGFMAPSPYWTLASLAGLDYTMVICDVDPGTDARRGGVANADLLVDVTALGRLLSR